MRRLQWLSVMCASALSVAACSPASRSTNTADYLELLQLASHLQQQTGRDPLAGGQYRFYALRERLTDQGVLVTRAQSIPVTNAAEQSAHLRSLLWLFDTVELGQLSLDYHHNQHRWAITYWIRADQANRLDRHIQSMAPVLAAAPIGR
ncbi:MAG: hypothetical protein PF961_18345 [Planctomycetota bacterium]|jgi:hypothetical protein|nr:hypothetical protein [Planctomycetota bacterium]